MHHGRMASVYAGSGAATGNEFFLLAEADASDTCKRANILTRAVAKIKPIKRHFMIKIRGYVDIKTMCVFTDLILSFRFIGF